MSDNPALEVTGLSKGFSGVPVLDKITFKIEGPQVVALLGANGVGKSTLMRLVAGFLPPDDGTIAINGISTDSNPSEARKYLGYLPENAPSHSGFRVIEALSFTASAYGLKGTALKNAVEAVIAECSLEKVADRICDQLSKGYHRRLGLAQALVHRPRLLMLDEPTDGLDPTQKASARELLKRLGRCHSVLVSTHLLEEVLLICDRVIIIKDGGIRYDGPVPSDLEERFLDAK